MPGKILRLAKHARAGASSGEQRQTARRLAYALRGEPWPVRREACVGVGRLLGRDPDAMADAIDDQLEAWRVEREKAA